MSTPTWYDVLGVDPDATPDEIRTAWRDGISDLSPGDRRFRSLNQAAEVLLDEKARANYDAQLPTEAEDTTQPDGSVEASGTAPTRQKKDGGASRGRFFSGRSAKAEREPKVSDKTQPNASSTAIATLDHEATPAEPADNPTTAVVTRTGPPVWLLIPLAILTALLVAAAAFLLTQPSDSAVATNTDDAQGAAEQAATTILGYDYRQLDADQKAADALMTPSFADKYNALFATIKQNAPSIKPVVTPQVLASGIVRSGDDRVEVLVFVNQTTTRGDGSQLINHNQARFTMVKSGNQWLVSDLQTSSAAS